MSLSLHEVLRQNDVETMLRNARITARCDDGAEKRQEAVRQVHLAMYRAGLSQITAEEREQILMILRPCCPEVFIAVPNRERPCSGVWHPRGTACHWRPGELASGENAMTSIGRFVAHPCRHATLPKNQNRRLPLL